MIETSKILLIVKYLELFFRIRLLLYCCKQLVTSDGYNPPVRAIPRHGVRLACPRLAICEEGCIVAMPGIGQHPFSQVTEHFLLQFNNIYSTIVHSVCDVYMTTNNK